MNDIPRITEALRRLNDLEVKNLGKAEILSPAEKAIAIAQLREILPLTLLAHHDRLASRGKRSLATVENGICGGCHLRLPSGHRHQKAEGGHLDVCENCGVFLAWRAEEPVARLIEKVARVGRVRKSAAKGAAR